MIVEYLYVKAKCLPLLDRKHHGLWNKLYDRYEDMDEDDKLRACNQMKEEQAAIMRIEMGRKLADALARK